MASYCCRIVAEIQKVCSPPLPIPDPNTPAFRVSLITEYLYHFTEQSQRIRPVLLSIQGIDRAAHIVHQAHSLYALAGVRRHRLSSYNGRCHSRRHSKLTRHSAIRGDCTVLKDSRVKSASVISLLSGPLR
jgi:hypothetical protein